MTAFIQTKQLTFAYHTGDKTPVLALSGVNLTVRRGEFVALVGANGSGKSTLARHLNALLLPSEGQVLVNGLDTREPTNLWPIRDQIAMVFQNPDNQIVAAIVEEDVAFGPENLGLPPAEIRDRVDQALRAVGLTPYAQREPHRLSGGQKQRLAVAGALALRPSCLVLDEATAMLDPSGRRQLLELVKGLHRQGLTIVMITHHMEEAAEAERVVLLSKGQVLKEGPPGEVLTDPALLAEAGLELPPAASLAAALRQEGVPLPPVVTFAELVDALAALRPAAQPRG